jgi:hypothetical protein
MGKMRIRELWSTIGVVLMLCACLGCNGGANNHPVEGKVTLDGRPLEQVHLIFYPVKADPANPARFIGLTDANGHFVMRSDEGKSEGMPAGRYRVSLTTAIAGVESDETTPLPPERVPAKYRDGKLEFEVPEGGTKQANFDLKSR